MRIHKSSKGALGRHITSAIAITTTLGLGALPQLVSPAGAQTSSSCPATATSCSTTNLNVGDTSTPSSSTGSTSSSSQSGTSAASNASDTTISPTISPTTTQSATNSTNGGTANTTGTISGGTTSSTGGTTSSNGGTVTGNTNSATNSTGASTSTIGDTTTGASTSSIGNTTNAATTTGGTATTSTGTITGGTNSNTTGASTSSTGPVTTGAVTTGAVTTGAVTTGSTTTNTTTGATTTTVDASDRSVSNYKAIFIPSVVPLTPSSNLAVGNIVKETGSCGPLQTVVREKITGYYFGIISTGRVPLGYNDRLAPFVDAKGERQDYREVPLPDGTGYRLFGHQVTQYTTVLGVASNRNIALGGGGSSGSWGQGGLGASSSIQQFVTSIQLRECEIGTVIRQPVAPPVAALAPAPRSAVLPDAVYVEKKKIKG